MEFSRQEYWSGCHFLLQGPNPRLSGLPRWWADPVPLAKRQDAIYNCWIFCSERMLPCMYTHTHTLSSYTLSCSHPTDSSPTQLGNFANECGKDHSRFLADLSQCFPEALVDAFREVKFWLPKALCTVFPGGTGGKELACQCRRQQVRSLDWEDPLEEGVTIHSCVLAWRIPWTEEPGGLYSPWGCKELDMTEAT